MFWCHKNINSAISDLSNIIPFLIRFNLNYSNRFFLKKTMNMYKNANKYIKNKLDL